MRLRPAIAGQRCRPGIHTPCGGYGFRACTSAGCRRLERHLRCAIAHRRMTNLLLSLESGSMSPRNMLNGAQVIVDYLIQEKVPQVFGLCGHGNIQFIDALYERSSEIKTISVHHESVAGFMADVYYRVSG